MTGSKQGAMVMGFGSVILACITVILGILAAIAWFVSFPMLAGVLTCLSGVFGIAAVFAWLALRDIEKRNAASAADSELERRRNSPFYNALCVLQEQLRDTLPRGSYSTGQRRSDDGEDYLVVMPSPAQVEWVDNAPGSVAGTSYDAWKALIPTTVEGFRVEVEVWRGTQF